VGKIVNPFEGFTAADTFARQRIIARSLGEFGTGKTHFWLGAPSPTVVFSMDRGLEGVVEKFAGREIYYKEYNWSPVRAAKEEKTLQEQAIELRDQFLEDFERAVGIARTVILDKETDIWELFRYAEFGAPNDDPRNYPYLNSQYRDWINIGKESDCNMGFIQSMKDEWGSVINPKNGKKQGQATGRRIPQGFGELEGLVHMNLTHSWRLQKDDEGNQRPVFVIEAGKTRGPGGFDVQGQTYENVTFAQFAQEVFPDSDPSDWEDS
jgi:hypothetical protein